MFSIYADAAFLATETFHSFAKAVLYRYFYIIMSYAKLLRSNVAASIDFKARFNPLFGTHNSMECVKTVSLDAAAAARRRDDFIETKDSGDGRHRRSSLRGLNLAATCRDY